jgi:hypothetical protein
MRTGMDTGGPRHAHDCNVVGGAVLPGARCGSRPRSTPSSAGAEPTGRPLDRMREQLAEEAAHVGARVGAGLQDLGRQLCPGLVEGAVHDRGGGELRPQRDLQRQRPAAVIGVRDQDLAHGWRHLAAYDLASHGLFLPGGLGPQGRPALGQILKRMWGGPGWPRSGTKPQSGQVGHQVEHDGLVLDLSPGAEIGREPRRGIPSGGAVPVRYLI